MKKDDIRAGWKYLAKVGGKVVTVRVDRIAPAPSGPGWRFYVTNLATGRHTVFRSAAKFRGPATEPGTAC